MAAEKGLHSVVTNTCKVMGMEALHNNNIRSAMAWALQSGDAKFTTFLADKLLSEYANSGTFSNTDLLDNRELHRLVHDSDFAQAAFLLNSLLCSKLAPKYLTNYQQC